jgi:hypothetical protein
MIKLILQKPDTLGAIASALCVIHCLATPFIFIVHTCAIGGCETSPNWWYNLDYLFLLISFLAVFNSVKNTSKIFMKPLLCLSWLILFLLILNQKTQLVSLPEIITYTAALSLSVLHIYNMKYCQCKTSKCCTYHG